jgi:hypothetical protein
MPAPIEEQHQAERPAGPGDIAGRDRPLVLRGLCSDWPIVARAHESDTAFAQALAAFDNGTPVDALLMPRKEQGVVGYDATLDAFNYQHFRVPVTDVLKRLAAYSREQDPPGLAMQSALVSACLPGLLDAHALSWLDAAIQPRLWIGNHVTTPAHFDEFHNIAVVVAGSRRFTLFPPEQVANLYIGPLDFAPTGAAISVARLDHPEDPRFPRLRDALAHACVAELQPGDAIYIPPLWWHHVASLGRINALVNYWWKPVTRDGRAAETGLGALMHAILAFKSLPSAQRDAWKVLFDHYVFGDEDPAAHIPESRRGLLGALTPEQVVELKERIRKYL